MKKNQKETHDDLTRPNKLILHFHGLWREAVDSNIAFQEALGKAGDLLSEEEYAQVVDVFNNTLALMKSSRA